MFAIRQLPLMKEKKIVTKELSKFKSVVKKYSEPFHLKITDQEVINKSNSKPINKS